MQVIKEAPGYLVSREGGIFSAKTSTIIQLKTRIDRYGYELVTLWVGGPITRKVHRLVAIAYLENPLNLPTVNHIDGNKLNNHVTNLEWLSMMDNHRHGFATGLQKIGSSKSVSKLTDADIPRIRELIKQGMGNTEIGKLFGVSCGCIYSIKIGHSWSHIQ